MKYLSILLMVISIGCGSTKNTSNIPTYSMEVCGVNFNILVDRPIDAQGQYLPDGQYFTITDDIKCVYSINHGLPTLIGYSYMMN